MKKVEITEKQLNQFNTMRMVLFQICNRYQTVNQLRKSSNSDYGLEYEEALEMAYENIKEQAKLAIKGVKTLVP